LCVFVRRFTRNNLVAGTQAINKPLYCISQRHAARKASAANINAASTLLDVRSLFPAA
jgi:hypothetical protein